MCCHILFWVTFSSLQLLFYFCLCYLEAWTLPLKIKTLFYGIMANTKDKYFVWGVFLSTNQVILKSVIFFLIELSMIEWQTLLNSPKLPLFPYNLHLFHFAYGLLSYIYAIFFSFCLVVFFSLPLMYLSFQ